MPATISVVRTETLNVVQTYSGGLSADNTATYAPLNTDATTYTASTSVPVTKFSSGEKTLSGGAGTLNLAALPGVTADETVDGTGLKVQFAWFRNKSTNANNITITFGASNPYNLLGSAFVMVLAPGQSVKIFGNEATPDVASGAKNIDLAGTASQILEYQIVMG